MQGILQQTIIQMLFDNEATYGIDMVCSTLKLNILKILNKGH